MSFTHNYLTVKNLQESIRKVFSFIHLLFDFRYLFTSFNEQFRKSHPDVYWLRFGTEEKASNYLSRLQRRIDSQTQPSVFERITNALRRRLQSPVKQQD